ncbi:MAG: ATPase AAA [Patescibacteria group bacterium]|nr:MAG: ATPase AAA [Patescibacteria group bacterium]
MNLPISAAILADVPVLWYGMPGIGKTARIYQAAKKYGVHIEDIRGSRIRPIDLGVLLPRITKTSAELIEAPPAWALRLRKAVDAGRPAWLFLGELSCVPPETQAALLGVVQERNIAGVDLSGVRIIADANPYEMTTTGYLFEPAMANRFFHLKANPDLDSWAAWLEGDPSADEFIHPKAIMNINYDKLSDLTAQARRFLASLARRFRDLVSLPKKAQARSEPWGSFRTWDMAMRMLAALAYITDSSIREVSLSDDGHLVVHGCVGIDYAASWNKWITYMDLPDPSDLLEGKADLPEDQHTMSIALESAAALVTKESPKEVKEALASLIREVAINRNRPDLALKAAKMAIAAGVMLDDAVLDKLMP